MIEIYCDASFSHKHKLAVSGYLIVEENQRREFVFEFSEKNNIRAELRGVIEALKSQAPKQGISLYTDCQAISSLLKRRQKLESTGFITAKGKTLNNADLYEKFYTHYDRVKPIIHWVKGHTRNYSRDDVAKNFSYVDRLVRKKLKEKLGGD